MKIGIDYRPVIAAPFSGISRQVLGMEKVFESTRGIGVLKFSPCSSDNKLRRSLKTPSKPGDESGLHRPTERFRFEYGFLPNAIKEQELDVYIATANQGLPLWRKPKGFKSILLLHDIFQLIYKGDSHKSIFKRLVYRCIDYLSIRFSIKQADYIWTPSEYTKREVMKYFPKVESKIRVLPNLVAGISGELKIRNTYGFPAKYWLIVGISEPRKNIPWFIEAWKNARNQNLSIPDLILVGDRAELPENLRNEKGLHFMTGISDEILHALYSYAELLWMPSYAEGFGLPVIEALSVGTPVATAYGSSLDEITPEISLRFDSSNAKKLCELMYSICEDPLEVNKKQLQDWAQKFSMQEYSKRLLELLDEVKK